MNKTKEEILNSKFTMDWPMGIPFTEIYDAMQEYTEQQTTTLTDQIKSMENYISDVDGQVKGISELYRVCLSQLESLQKEVKECNETLPTDIAKFFIWANEKFQTDGKGSYKVVRDGCITFYSTNELYKDWKRGLL